MTCDPAIVPPDTPPLASKAVLGGHFLVKRALSLYPIPLPLTVHHESSLLMDCLGIMLIEELGNSDK